MVRASIFVLFFTLLLTCRIPFKHDAFIHPVKRLPSSTTYSTTRHQLNGLSAISKKDLFHDTNDSPNTHPLAFYSSLSINCFFHHDVKDKYYFCFVSPLLSESYSFRKKSKLLALSNVDTSVTSISFLESNRQSNNISPTFSRGLHVRSLQFSPNLLNTHYHFKKIFKLLLPKRVTAIQIRDYAKKIVKNIQNFMDNTNRIEAISSNSTSVTVEMVSVHSLMQFYRTRFFIFAWISNSTNDNFYIQVQKHSFSSKPNYPSLPFPNMSTFPFNATYNSSISTYNRFEF